MANPILSTDILLTRVEQVRALARSLVADDADVQDVTQDALVVALRREDESAGPMPEWLRSTVRSLASRVRRSNARRIGREHAAARHESIPSTAQLCERASVQRTVVDAVIGLEEPYRTTILLRYFEGLPPAAIATHLHVPVATVKKRLTRGREQLRGRLERHFGPKTWSALVAPCALPHPHATQVSLVASGVLMSSNLKIIAACAAVLVGIALTVVLQHGVDPSSPMQRPPADAVRLGDVDTSADGSVKLPVAANSERIPADLPATKADSAAVQAGEMLEGRVIDGTGAPVSGVSVHLGWNSGEREFVPFPDSPSTVTDAQGIFRLQPPSRIGQLEASSERHVTIIGAPWVPGGAFREPTIVVGERSTYAGIVVDHAGNALPGAIVRTELDLAALRSLFPGEERSLEETRSAVAQAGGEFALIDIGWMPGTKLRALLRPFEPTRVALGPGDHRNLEIVLERPAAGEVALHGRVVRTDGGSVAGVQVAYAGGDQAAAAPDGTFVLDLGDERASGQLVAVLPGFLPACMAISDPLLACEESREEPIVLKLEGSALSISGTVVDASGTPVPGAVVWTEDGVPFSHARTVEDLAATDVQWRGRRAEAKAEGAFEIDGLLDADYDLYAVHPATFRVLAIGGVRAGARDVRFVFDDTPAGVRVAGKVLYRDGKPASGVRIYPMLRPRSSSRVARPPFMSRSSRATDEEGRFEFAALHSEGLALWITGDEIGEPAERIEIELESCTDLEHIEVRVPRVVRFEIVLRGDPDQADEFGVIDGEGRLLELTCTLSSAVTTQTTTGSRLTLSAGHSEVVSCSEDARTLILYRGENEVRRIPVRLNPGKVTVLGE